MHRVQGAGGHRHPAPQRQLLRRALPAAVPRPGGPGHQGLRHARARRAGARRGVRRQGLARRVGHPPRARLPGRRPLPRLGIGDYSDHSGEMARAFASARGLTLHEVDLPDRARLRHPHRGQGGPAGAVLGVRPVEAPPVRRRRPHGRLRRASSPATTSTTRRRCCSATSCTGRPTTSAASCRCCPARNGFPRKVKPLVRLGEREMAAYCVLRGIDYIVEECPMAAGNKHLGYKEALNAIEATSPGQQARLLLRVPRPGVRAVHRRRPRTSQEQLQRVRAAAARRPPARCARSAAWSSGPRAVPVELGRKATLDEPRRSRRGAGAADRLQEAPLPAHPHRGQGVPLPLRRGRPRRGDRRRSRAPRSGRPTG